MRNESKSFRNHQLNLFDWAESFRNRQLNLFDWAGSVTHKLAAMPQAAELALPEIDGLEFNLVGAGANTAIGYMYRDADNYKRFKDVVLKGRLSRADIRRMFDAINDYVFFIPSDVGLQDLQPLFETGWETEADHPWHSFYKIAYVDDSPTSDEYQDIMTTTEFVARWPKTAVGWDEIGAEERLIEAMGLSAGSQKLTDSEW